MSAVQERISAGDCWHRAGKELKEMRFQKTKLRSFLSLEVIERWKKSNQLYPPPPPKLTTLIDNAIILPGETQSVCGLLVKHEVKGPLQSEEDLNSKSLIFFFWTTLYLVSWLCSGISLPFHVCTWNAWGGRRATTLLPAKIRAHISEKQHDTVWK